MRDSAPPARLIPSKPDSYASAAKIQTQTTDQLPHSGQPGTVATLYQSGPWPVMLGNPVCAIKPPSATIHAPLTYEASSEARNSTTFPLSLASPYPPTGTPPPAFPS